MVVEEEDVLGKLLVSIATAVLSHVLLLSNLNADFFSLCWNSSVSTCAQLNQVLCSAQATENFASNSHKVQWTPANT